MKRTCLEASDQRLALTRSAAMDSGPGNDTWIDDGHPSPGLSMASAMAQLEMDVRCHPAMELAAVS